MKPNINTIFPLGDLIEGPNFSGDAYLSMLTEGEQPIANVTFAPGCRNRWHEHMGGQILLVTSGEGWYQEWGKEPQTLHPGDVVEIGAHVKHWHGANKDHWLSHIALEVHPELGPATWLEAVDEQQYESLG